MWGSTGVAPDPLLQFLQRVVPWGQAGQPPSYVNFHGFTPKADTRTQFIKRGGGPAFESMLEAGDMLLWIAQLNRSGDEGFFCLSSRSGFKLDARGRKRASRKRGVSHAVMLRAFVLDLDIKAGGYPNLQAALAGVLPFLDGLGLKVGAIVKTGGGLHVYVFLDQPIAAAVWRPLAAALAAAAVAAKVKLDVVVTKDDDRILRLPTTFNRKEPTPRPCELSYLGTDTPLTTVQAALAPWIKTTPGVATTNQPRVSVDLSWLPPRPPITSGPDFDRVSAEHEKIRVRTSFGLLCAACPVVMDTAQRQGDGDMEPLWFEIAKLCQYIENGRQTFHYLSAGDPRYDHDQADHKFDTVQKEGWPACATIAASSPAANALCQTCVFNGKGQSPIHHAIMGGSGRPVAASATTLPPPASPVNGINGHTHVNPFVSAVQPITYQWLPTGYVIDPQTKLILPANGGPPIFENPIIDASLNYETVGPKTHEPVLQLVTLRGTKDADDTNTFGIPLNELYSAADFSKAVMQYGLIPRDPPIARTFAMDLLTMIKNTGGATTHRRQGWTEDDQGNIVGFTYGNRLYSPSGPGPVGASEPWYSPRGTLAAWQQAASIFIGKGCIEIEIVIAAAFATPLIRFTAVEGVTVLARSSQSGEGKTASLETSASVWMSRNGMMRDGTQAAVLARMTKMNNLPMFYDELLKNNDERSAREAAKLVLNVASGRQPDRLNRNATEKLQLPSRTMLIGTSNLSLSDVARLADTNAQAARILEFELSNSIQKLKLTQADGALYKDIMEKNYGNAGAMYAEFLGRHHAGLQAIVTSEVDALQKITGAGDGERFWLAAAATISVGAVIAQRLGLLPFDTIGIRRFLIELIRTQRKAMLDRANNASDPDVQLQRVVEFINQNQSSIIVTPHMPKPGFNRTTPLNAMTIRSFSGFAGRFGQQDSKWWISEKKLEAFCKPRSYNFHEMKKVLVKANYCKRLTTTRSLGAGCGAEYSTASEFVLEFITTDPRLADMIVNVPGDAP